MIVPKLYPLFEGLKEFFVELAKAQCTCGQFREAFDLIPGNHASVCVYRLIIEGKAELKG